MSLTDAESSKLWNRIEDLFHAALERPAAERSRFVAEACASNAKLRDEVQRLLDCHEQSGEFIEPPADAIPKPAASLEGRRIGQFQVTRVIASGGMGTVYEALQDSPQRSVAIKVMRSALPSDNSLHRFETEVAVLGRLRHPGIAQILEAGTHVDGDQRVPFYAMEYIDGAQSIIEYARASQLDVAARLRLFAKVCDAVNYGHQHGVIHRDLKPANILVDPSGNPKIIDFGVARLLDAEAPRTTFQTSVGQLIGTLSYLSPDQCAGDSREVDTRTDVYALGVVLYELLCGQLPYDVHDKTIVQIATIIRDAPPARPSSINRLLRGDVETIVLKAIAKERGARYQSASEFAGDIRSFLNDEPIRAHPPSAVYQLRMFARRNRTLVAAAAVVLAILIGATVVSSVFWSREAVQRERAERIAVQERDQREKAERIKGYLVQLLSSPNPELARGEEVTVREVLDRVAPQLSTDLGGLPEVEAEMHEVVGMTYHGLGLFEAAEPHVRRSVELYRGLDENSTDHVDALQNLGAVLVGLGHYGEAETIYREATQRGQRIWGPDHPRVAQSLAGRAESLRFRHQPGAEPLYLRAIAILDDHPEVDDGSAANGLALLYDSMGRFAEAEELFRISLNKTRAYYGEDHYHVATGLNNIAGLYFERGEPHKALQLFKEVLGIYRRLLGDDHVIVAHARNNMGVVLRELGDLQAAEEALRESMDAYRRLLGETHPQYATSLNNVGALLVTQGKSGEALPMLEQALELRLKLFSPQHPDIATTRHQLARAYLASGRFGDAEAEAREALRITRHALPEDHPRLAMALELLGTILLKIADAGAAEPLLRDSLEVWRVARPGGGIKVNRTMALLGMALIDQERFAEAEALLLDAYAGASETPDGERDPNAPLAAALARLYRAWGREDEAAKYDARQEPLPDVPAAQLAPEIGE